MAVTTKSDFRRLDHIIHSLNGRTDDVLRDISLELVEETRQVITEMGAVDTGRMLDSVEARPEGTLKAVVSVTARSKDGAPYPLFVHEGYHRRNGLYVPGRGFLRVASERVRVRLPDHFRKLFQR